MKKAAVVLTAFVMTLNATAFAQVDTVKKTHHKKTTTHKTTGMAKDSSKHKM